MDKLMQRCCLLTARCLVDNFLANIPDISQPGTLLKLVLFLEKNFSLNWRLAKCGDVRRIKSDCPELLHTFLRSLYDIGRNSNSAYIFHMLKKLTPYYKG